jgi:hypothetical protein
MPRKWTEARSKQASTSGAGLPGCEAWGRHSMDEHLHRRRHRKRRHYIEHGRHIRRLAANPTWEPRSNDYSCSQATPFRWASVVFRLPFDEPICVGAMDAPRRAPLLQPTGVGHRRRECRLRIHYSTEVMGSHRSTSLERVGLLTSFAYPSRAKRRRSACRPSKLLPHRYLLRTMQSQSH